MMSISFTCGNPFCARSNKTFLNERGFNLHLRRAPSCASFVEQRQRERNAIVHSVNNEVHINLKSTQQPASLHRDWLNHGMIDIPHASNTPFCNVLKEQEVDAFESIDHVDFDDVPPAISVSVIPSKSQYICTKEEKWTVALLKLVDDLNLSDESFKRILEWAQGAVGDNYSFFPKGGNSRQRNIKITCDNLQNGKLLLPSVVPVPSAAHTEPSDVVVYDFVPQLLQLLQNPNIMVADNLVIDVLNPLQKYQSPNNILNEAISGSVYRNAYDRMITNPQKQLFVPIIQWIDRTHVTGNARYSLKPYIFTPAIFTETFRRKFEAWGYHGFLPKRKESRAENEIKLQGDNLRRYHAELDVVLSTFKTANQRLTNIQLPLGPQGQIVVDIVTCVLFVIQDIQEGDQLCGRFGPHSSKIRRQCRACDVNYDNLNNPNVLCNFLKADTMHEMALQGTDDERKRWSQHKLNNVFFRIPMADPVFGIMGSTPTETMHAFRKGMIEKVTLLVFEKLTAGQKAKLDGLAVDFHKKHPQTYRSTYPATDFSNGITNLTKITANERLGLVFLFVILSHYDEGKHIIASALEARTNTHFAAILQLFEAMLCFDAWLNLPSFWPQNELANDITMTVQKSIKTLMQMCVRRLPNGKWKFPKFHELLHIVNDMKRFGSPLNYCAQRPEGLLIQAAKQPGRRAQKRSDGCEYERQSAQRLAGTMIVNIVHNLIHPNPTDTNEQIDNNTSQNLGIHESTGQATFANVAFHSTTKSFDIRWNTKSDTNKMSLPIELLLVLKAQFGHNFCICTEYRRDNYIFRCHPYYQSRGPKYDWMKIKFVQGSFPCRLAVVVVLGDRGKHQEYKLVVQSATKRLKHSSVLMKKWAWSPQYYIVDPDTIEAPCFVVSTEANDSIILETVLYQEWASHFTDISEYDDNEDFQ